MWEKPGPKRVLLVYTMDKPAYAPAGRVVAAITAILRWCYVAYFQSHRYRSPELEILLKRLLSGVTAPTSTPPLQTAMAGVEALLQHLLLGMPGMASRARPGPARSRRDWNTIVCSPVASRVTG